jgi:hypothetical protein
MARAVRLSDGCALKEYRSIEYIIHACTTQKCISWFSARSFSSRFECIESRVWKPVENLPRKLFFGQYILHSLGDAHQGCQMFVFKPKIQIWVNFGGSCNGRWWCIFYGHLVHFTVFCYILSTFGIVRGNMYGIFFPFWYFVPRTIWQPCSPQILYCSVATKGSISAGFHN